MKNSLLLFLSLTLFTINLSYSQEDAKVENFGCTKDAPSLVNQFVVIEKDSMTVAEGYKWATDWIKITYNTPKEVIKSEIENEYIRIEGIKGNSPCIKSLGMLICWDTKYSISFEFKENKIKFQVTRLQLYTAPSQYSTGGWSDSDSTYASLTRKNGKPAKDMISMDKGFNDTLNDLKNSFEQYINNPIKEKTTKSDW